MIEIRFAADQDADAVYALARRFATSFVVEEPTFRPSFARLIAAPDAFVAVAEAQGRVVGYVLGFDHDTFYANGRVAWVEEIMVEEGMWRQGVGQNLMQEFEGWAAARGARLAALATRRAASFYEAMGYEESAVYFRKKLS